MFDFFRKHTRLLQGLLVLLIFPSFVVFGIQGYSSFTDKANAEVATVGSAKITEAELEAAHRRQVERMRQQMPDVDIKLLDTPQMRRQTLDQLVREQVLLTAAAKEHLTVPDERLQRLFRTDPQFAALRKPDGSVNKEFLAAQGMSSAMFAEQLRQDYAMRQVLQGAGGSSLSGKTVLDGAIQALLEQREVQLQRFEAPNYLARIQPTEAQMEAYYKANTAKFRSTEEARIEYAVLDLATLKAQIQLSDEDLRKYYEENLARYTSAEERRASHILINAPKDAPAAERDKAKAQAEALLAQARKNPAGFAELARKNSNDPGSADRGGDLDFFGRGAMTKPFEDAVFAMKVDEISPVVETEFGYHLIKLTALRGGQRKPFEAVRAEMVEEISKQQAQKRYAEAAEQFTNMVYEQSDSLKPVADKFKLTLSTATVQRRPAPGATGPLASAKLLDAVFGNDAVKNSRNTEAVETGASQLVSARVLEHRPERVLSLAEVKPQVLAQVQADAAAAAARQEGEARLAALRQKPDDSSLPASLKLSRTQTNGLPREVVQAVLGADLSKGPALLGVSLGQQGYVLARVLKVVPREAADPDLNRARPSITQALANAETQAYYEALKKRYKAEIKAEALKAPATPEAAGSAASK